MRLVTNTTAHFLFCVCVCVGVPRSAYRKEKTGSKLAFVFRVFTLFLFVFPFFPPLLCLFAPVASPMPTQCVSAFVV